MRRPQNTQRPGRGSAQAGWTQPLDELWTQARAEIHALKARIEGELAQVQAVPAVYQGVRVFHPDVGSTETVTDPTTGDPVEVNYVVRDGQTYEIPVRFPGPGVFVARSLEVNVYQRFVTSAGDDYRLLARTFNTVLAQTDQRDSDLRTFRYSILQAYDGTPGNPETWPNANGGLSDAHEDPVPAVQFWWNIIDGKSGRQFADELVPAQALMPMTCSHYGVEEGGEQEIIQGLRGLPIDGGRFYFDTAWLIERDGQFRFLWRPTTAMLQLASTPLSQKQDVFVQVELHGERYETLQDAMKVGAMTRPVRREEE